MLNSLGLVYLSLFIINLTEKKINITTGQDTKDELLEEMIAEAPGQINFTMFLTLFGEKLNGCLPLLLSCMHHFLIFIITFFLAPL